MVSKQAVEKEPEIANLDVQAWKIIIGNFHYLCMENKAAPEAIPN